VCFYGALLLKERKKQVVFGRVLPVSSELFSYGASMISSSVFSIAILRELILFVSLVFFKGEDFLLIFLS